MRCPAKGSLPRNGSSIATPTSPGSAPICRSTHQNGLLLGYKFNTAWRGGNGAAEAVFEAYKSFDGVLFATKQIGHDGKDTDISFIDSVSWDDVPDSALELPAAVKAKRAR